MKRGALVFCAFTILLLIVFGIVACTGNGSSLESNNSSESGNQESNTATDTNEQNAYTVLFSCDTSLGKIIGEAEQTVLEGEKTSPVSVYVNYGYRFIGWSSGATEPEISITVSENCEISAIIVPVSDSIPTVSILTDGKEEITSTSEYLNCVVSIGNANEIYCFENEGAKIRGRGNTTWEYEKKPYRLKFDTKIDLFGNGKAKDWVLLTNYSDLSLSRNFLAQSVTSLFGTINSCCSVQFVELYVNEEYLGVYLICEQIEVEKSRIEITKSVDVDTGYLIELDNRKDGRYFKIGSTPYVIKSPSTDSSAYTDEHEEFIKSYLTECFIAIGGNDYDKICSLIDVESFAESYIVYELFNGVDVGYSSFFMYKDAGGKLHAGSPWDFDRSLGIVGHSKGAKPYDALWAKEQNTWFYWLLRHEEFNSLVGEKLTEYAPKIKEKLNECYEYLYKNREAFEKNFEKWDILGTFVWPNDDELTTLNTWDLQVEYTRNYLNNSLDFLITTYCPNNTN